MRENRGLRMAALLAWLVMGWGARAAALDPEPTPLWDGERSGVRISRMRSSGAQVTISDSCGGGTRTYTQLLTDWLSPAHSDRGEAFNYYWDRCVTGVAPPSSGDSAKGGPTDSAQPKSPGAEPKPQGTPVAQASPAPDSSPTPGTGPNRPPPIPDDLKGLVGLMPDGKLGFLGDSTRLADASSPKRDPVDDKTPTPQDLNPKPGDGSRHQASLAPADGTPPPVDAGPRPSPAPADDDKRPPAPGYADSAPPTILRADKTPASPFTDALFPPASAPPDPDRTPGPSRAVVFSPEGPDGDAAKRPDQPAPSASLLLLMDEVARKLASSGPPTSPTPEVPGALPPAVLAKADGDGLPGGVPVPAGTGAGAKAPDGVGAPASPQPLGAYLPVGSLAVLSTVSDVPFGDTPGPRLDGDPRPRSPLSEALSRTGKRAAAKAPPPGALPHWTSMKTAMKRGLQRALAAWRAHAASKKPTVAAGIGSGRLEDDFRLPHAIPALLERIANATPESDPEGDRMGSLILLGLLAWFPLSLLLGALLVARARRRARRAESSAPAAP